MNETPDRRIHDLEIEVSTLGAHIRHMQTISTQQVEKIRTLEARVRDLEQQLTIREMIHERETNP